ncbi:family 43 glycosylhydrolase [Flavobacterium cellulosilyticum]|uniref:family 43 glycosylhydrolase n=1 Tax=Flavobacterium cellulosilyticum TaxID=2541731 RepID=UPI00248216E0|nr:family 43 glycosylhydrolase [Flavobacterium cellulosilyticum]
MPNWLVFSSKDLKNWEEYEVPLKTSDFQWASGNFSWASQVIERNGKFYWFVSTEHSSMPRKAIGVAVSNSPTGPFIDAKGTALITNNMTTKWTGISWDDIDPTVWVDDDGQAYIFWGKSKCYYAKLKDNRIELDSEIMNVSLPNFTEAPWIHKRGDWYYLSYSAWWPEKTVYAMGQSINGPWEYKGILNELAGNSNTNHHAIVEYGDNWYFVYHNGGTRTNGGSYLSSVCMDYLYYNEDNSIKSIQMTTEGVKKLEAITMSIEVNPNKRTQIKVYPNPTDGIIKVELPDEDLMNYELALFDMKGVKQLSSFLDNTKKSQLNLSHLSKGIYILNCINSDRLI